MLSMFGFYVHSFGRAKVAGRRLYVSSAGCEVFLRPVDMGTFAEIFLKRHYAFDHLKNHAEALRFYVGSQETEPLIIDCGANIGLSAIWFSQCFPSATIYAVEPAALNYALLEANTSQLRNVHALQGAVWHEPTSLSFKYLEHRPSGSQVDLNISAPDSDGSTQVRGYSVPEIIAMAGNADPLIVKIDVEGSEKYLFRSNTGWVRQTMLIMIETHDWMKPFQRVSTPFWSCIAEQGFDVIYSGETIFCFNSSLGRYCDLNALKF
jgi:FkbM family methyltransferase